MVGKGGEVIIFRCMLCHAEFRSHARTVRQIGADAESLTAYMDEMDRVGRELAKSLTRECGLKADNEVLTASLAQARAERDGLRTKA